MALPPIKLKDGSDNPLWQAEVVSYLASDVVWRTNRATELGYSNREVYMGLMRRRGLECPQVATSDQIERKPVVQLPPVNLLPFKARRVKRRGDEEIAILHATDGHADKITQSYNKDIYKERMGKMFESAMTIINLHRNIYPIRKLVIFDTGDNVQGENPHQGSKAGEISMGARDQVKTLAVPMWNDVIGSFKQNFAEVEFDGIPGNHGYEQLSAETSRYDLLLYDVLEAGIGKEKGIKINVHDNWYALVRLWDFLFFLFHGDGIPCQQGVPFFALDKKLKSWYMQLGPFNYALGGHFHKRHSDEISSKLEYFMAGSLTSDDPWAQKKLGISSNPSQSIYGLHPKYGITWRYPLVVDDKFLPEPIPQDTSQESTD